MVYGKMWVSENERREHRRRERRWEKIWEPSTLTSAEKQTHDESEKVERRGKTDRHRQTDSEG